MPEAFEAAFDQRPATKLQLSKLARLAEKFGMPAPREGLTSLEATDALRGLEILNRWQQRTERGTKMPAPDPDPGLQPYATLRGWDTGKPVAP